MNISYFDLNQGWGEDYSLNPKRYGGGRVFAAHAKEVLNNEKDSFRLYGNAVCFENFGDKDNKSCYTAISQKQIDALRNGENVFNVIPDFKKSDILVHHFSNIYIHSDPFIPQVCWSVGYREQVHQSFKYAIFYNDYQFPILLNPKTKILKALIGKPVPPFQEYEKDDFIFQCSRHTNLFGTIEVASFCRKYQVPLILAGPIDKDYPLLDYVDNKLIKYLGIISEDKKNEYYRQSRLTTYIHSWPTPMNLSALESLSYGTPIVATPIGFWKSLINNKNGFIVNSEDQLLLAYQKAPQIQQVSCWQTAYNYSSDKMIDQFYNAICKALD